MLVKYVVDVDDLDDVAAYLAGVQRWIDFLKAEYGIS